MDEMWWSKDPASVTAPGSLPVQHVLPLGRRPAIILCCTILMALSWCYRPTCLHASDTLNWLGYETARQKSFESQRPLFIFFTTPWCYQCTEMKRKVFQNRDIAPILKERFLLVEVDLSHTTRLKDDFHVYVTPTSLFLDSHGKPITTVRGFIPANQFRTLLRSITEGTYNKVDVTVSQQR